MDLNADGVISVFELNYYLSKIMPEEEAKLQADTIMSKIDRDNNGVIDYTEFVRATVDSKEIFSQENIIKTFNHFDHENKGHISYEDLLKRFSHDNTIDRNLIQQFFASQNIENLKMNEFEEILLSENVSF